MKVLVGEKATIALVDIKWSTTLMTTRLVRGWSGEWGCNHKTIDQREVKYSSFSTVQLLIHRMQLDIANDCIGSHP